MCVLSFHQAKCSGSWVINSALDFGQVWTSIANIWNGSSAIDKRKTELSTTIFPKFDENNWVNFGPQTKKMTLTLKFNRVLEVVNVHVPAKFHQAACSGSWVIVLNFLPYLAIVKNPKMWSCDLDPLPMILKFSYFRTNGSQVTCSSKILSS